MITPRLSLSKNTLGREQPQTDSNARLRLISGCVASDPVDDPSPPIGDPPDDDAQDEPYDDADDDENEDEDDD